MTGAICLIFGRRSGTSSLAKALYEAGYPLRGPLDVREFDSAKDGHYENFEARAINGGMMRHFRINDKYPGLTPFLIHQGLEAWLADHESPFIVKEPRLCLTWPAWFRTAEACGRPVVAIWCRRPHEGQVRSLQTARGYEYERRDAKLCVEMYEHGIRLAAQMMPTLELWIEPDGPVRWVRSLFREHRAARWLDRHRILPNQGEHDGNGQEGEEGGAEGARDGSDAARGSRMPAGSGGGPVDRVEA